MVDLVIFACVHSAGRSQMAAAWFNLLADPQKARAIAAGTAPAAQVHPNVQAAMAEVGAALAEMQPRKLTEEMAETAVLLVTMGCGEACPVVPGLERLDWPLADPQSLPLAEVRPIRDEIHDLVAALVGLRGW